MADRAWCDIMDSRMITLLYDYLAKINFTSDSLQASRSHTLKTWYELPNPISKTNYLEELYFDILNLLLAQKSNNTSARRRAPQKLNAFLHYAETDLKVSSGFGIRNVNERLQLHYGNDSHLTYVNTAAGHLAAKLMIYTAIEAEPESRVPQRG